MQRTTISLPDDLAAALKREAKRLRVPVSQVAREAIETRLRRVPGKPRFPFIGLIRGEGQTDVSSRIDEILAAGWADAIERDRDR